MAKDNGPEEVDPGDVIKVETTLVTLPVSVMDRDGKYIPNLRKEDFRLWEDGTEQAVAFFAAVDKPFSVVLMLDTSGSTRFRIEEIQDAAITFVNQLRQDDRVMVVSFDDDIRVLADFTNDRGRLRDAIQRTRTGQGTKLYDAVDLTINQYLSRVSGRKAVVLFTDGLDTTSRYATYETNIRDAEELDALIYPVQYDTHTNAYGGGGVTWPNQGGSGSPIEDAIRIFGSILGGNNRSGGGGWRQVVAGVAVVEVDAVEAEPADTSTTPLPGIYTIWLREPVRATTKQTPLKICRQRLRASPTNYEGNIASAITRRTRVRRDSVVRLRCA